MAQKKPTAKRDVNIKSKAPAKSGAEKNAKKQEAASKQRVENLRLKEEIKSLKKKRNIEETFSYNFMPYILCFAGIFLTICFIIPDKMNILGKFANLLGGLFDVE